MRTRIRMIVIGGGYAGVMAANRLTQRDNVTVTLINPRAQFVERIRLHQFASGTHTAVHDYQHVLGPSVQLVVDTVTRINAPQRRVDLASGTSLDYDYLVYAVGSHGAAPDVPGAAEFAYPLSDLEEARRLRGALRDSPSSAAVTVVGAGPSGIETAAELAESGRAVTLIAGALLGPHLHHTGRGALTQRLVDLGVTVLEGEDATVAEVQRESVRLCDGREVPSAVTIWTAGFGVPDVAARSGLATDAIGRLLTDETLTSVDDDRIIATGDASAPSGLPYRMSCQAATQLGPQAAETVLSRVAGEQPAPVAVGFFGQCLSLGRSIGMFQFSRRDDIAIRVRLGGHPGAALKELVCRSTVWLLKLEARRPGMLRLWITDPHRKRQLRATQETRTSASRTG